jgi:hypothetical protein
MRLRRRGRSVDSSNPEGIQMNPIATQTLPRLSDRALEALLMEIRRYLEVVELFRAESREPRWT